MPSLAMPRGADLRRDAPLRRSGHQPTTALAQRYRYGLRADIVQHFASVDHAILLNILRRQITEADVMRLVEAIVDNGRSVLDDE